MAKCENNNCLEVEIKPDKIDNTKPVNTNLDNLKFRIEEKISLLNSNCKGYDYEIIKLEGTDIPIGYNMIVNGIKYDGKNYKNGEDLVSAIKIIDSILNIYMKNGNKNDFYFKNNGFDLIDIYLDDSIIPFGDTTYLTQESFTKNIGNKDDIKKFVNFLNQVTKTL